MSAGSRDFQRSFGLLLATDIGQIIRRRVNLGEIHFLQLIDGFFACEVGDDFGQRRRRVDAGTGEGCLHFIAFGHDDPPPGRFRC